MLLLLKTVCAFLYMLHMGTSFHASGISAPPALLRMINLCNTQMHQKQPIPAATKLGQAGLMRCKSILTMPECAARTSCVVSHYLFIRLIFI